MAGIQLQPMKWEKLSPSEFQQLQDLASYVSYFVENHDIEFFIESKICDRSYAVMRLSVHLPHQQIITFEAGNEDEILFAAQTGRTKLESWFQLNLNDQNAPHFLYTDIPQRYVYVRGKWQLRQRGGEKVVARMYTVSLRDANEVYPKLILNCKNGG